MWTFATRGKVDSSPVIVGDKVVVGSDDGRLYMVSLKDGKELSLKVTKALSRALTKKGSPSPAKQKGKVEGEGATEDNS